MADTLGWTPATAERRGVLGEPQVREPDGREVDGTVVADLGDRLALRDNLHVADRVSPEMDEQAELVILRQVQGPGERASARLPLGEEAGEERRDLHRARGERRPDGERRRDGQPGAAGDGGEGDVLTHPPHPAREDPGLVHVGHRSRVLGNHHGVAPRDSRAMAGTDRATSSSPSTSAIVPYSASPDALPDSASETLRCVVPARSATSPGVSRSRRRRSRSAAPTRRPYEH